MVSDLIRINGYDTEYVCIDDEFPGEEDFNGKLRSKWISFALFDYKIYQHEYEGRRSLMPGIVKRIYKPTGLPENLPKCVKIKRYNNHSDGAMEAYYTYFSPSKYKGCYSADNFFIELNVKGLDFNNLKNCPDLLGCESGTLSNLYHSRDITGFSFKMKGVCPVAASENGHINIGVEYDEDRYAVYSCANSCLEMSYNPAGNLCVAIGTDYSLDDYFAYLGYGKAKPF